MRVDCSIFLCGFMAAGKSAIGKALADLLEVPFQDLDKYIEHHEHRSVAQIFEERGEGYFRKLEATYVNQLMVKKPLIVALGGGTLQNEQILNMLQNNGFILFIDTPMDMILDRLKRNNKRPLLQNDDGSKMEDDILKEFVYRLHKKRLPIYQKAHLTYVPINGTALEQAERIVTLMHNLLEKEC